MDVKVSDVMGGLSIRFGTKVKISQLITSLSQAANKLCLRYLSQVVDKLGRTCCELVKRPDENIYQICYRAVSDTHLL